MFDWPRKSMHAASVKALYAARQEWLNEFDPNCDMCAAKNNLEPSNPVHRCPWHMTCMAGLIGDPLFGFDFEKYRDAQQNAGERGV
ncbi:hypothetical protein [Burkholderia sp. BCC0405]|uniref:hypothetical protein n=1 Tax=Burkholderia sp. BCC0405 TaxID=2676298 RepID=UPI00158BA1B3|nr:hypothetical protein [Burkholderia sp. BCC0405]